MAVPPFRAHMHPALHQQSPSHVLRLATDSTYPHSSNTGKLWWSTYHRYSCYVSAYPPPPATTNEGFRCTRRLDPCFIDTMAGATLHELPSTSAT